MTISSGLSALRSSLTGTLSSSRAPILLFLILFLPRAVPAAPAVLSDEAQTCMTCHAAPGMKTFGDKTTVSVRVDGRRFAASVHGSLDCTSCHRDVQLHNHPSAHYATKQQLVLHVAKACRTCHGDTQLMASPLHQRAISRTDAQPCSTCHGSHAIGKASVRKGSNSATQYCLTCHSKPLTRSIDGEAISLTIDEAWVKGSVHRNHECTDCHTAYSKENHPPPKAFASGRELSHAVSEICDRCHFEKAVKEKDSIHALLLAKGDQRAPGCSDCHGSHAVGPGALADTLDGVPCKKCHHDAYEAYRTSVHGMTKQSGRLHTPLCAACHKAHDVKPAMASRSPRDMCLDCHPSSDVNHRQRLPNPKAHLEMVACTACHVPFTYKRSIYLRFTDAATGRLVRDSEVRTLIKARGAANGQIGPRALWQLHRDMNEVHTVNVAVAVSMNDRRNAHYLAPKDIAVKQCEACHSADSSFFEAVAVATADSNGREVLHDVDPKALGSVYGAILLKRFYVMSGTRLTAMDYAGAMIILGGIAVPVLHGVARLMTRRLRTRGRKPEGRGGAMNRIYLHPLPVRMWHWFNALCFFVLIVTGAQIRYRGIMDLMSFRTAVDVHNFAGFTLIGLFLVWAVYYAASGTMKVYLPDLNIMRYARNSWQQARYYGYGIFLGEPNPHHATPERKFNPLQQLAYFSIMFFLMPILIATGILVWDLDRFAAVIDLLGGIKAVSAAHLLVAVFFAAFLFVHVYLTTLGRTPLEHIKAMFTGYEEEPEQGH